MQDEKLVHERGMRRRRQESELEKHGKLNTAGVTVTLVCLGIVKKAVYEVENYDFAPLI